MSFQRQPQSFAPKPSSLRSLLGSESDGQALITTPRTESFDSPILSQSSATRRPQFEINPSDFDFDSNEQERPLASDSDQAPAPTNTPRSEPFESPFLSPSSTTRRLQFETNLTDVDFDPQSRPPSNLNLLPTTPKRTKSKSTAFMKRVSSLFGIKNSPSPEPENDENHLDALPTTKADLDGRINFHLSELGRLKQNTIIMTEMIKSHEERTRIIGKREDVAKKIPVSMEMRAGVENDMRVGRNLFVGYVRYHISEVRRVAERKMKIQQEAGEEVTLPTVLQSELLEKNVWDAFFIQ